MGKAEELSIFFDDNKEAHLLEECRSRYAKFFGHQYVEHKLCVVTCDREPSRVPFKRLTRLLHKSRKIQKMVCKYVVKMCQCHLKCSAVSISVILIVKK